MPSEWYNKKKKCFTLKLQELSSISLSRFGLEKWRQLKAEGTQYILERSGLRICPYYLFVYV